MAGPKPFCCKECGLGFSQKCHLTRHVHIHAKETFVCDVCSKPFSRRDKLSCHIVHKHQTIVDKGHGYPCPQCRKTFSRKFNLARHKLLHTSIEKTNTGKAVLDEMKCNARLYKEQLQLGKDVANNLQEYDDIPELSLSTTHKQALELYKQSRLQHPHHYENVTLRHWQLKVNIFLFNHLPQLQRLWPMTYWRISKMDEPEVISIVLHRSCSKHPIQWWCFQMSTQGQRPSRRTSGGFIKSGVRFCMIKALQLLNADYTLLPIASSFATKIGDVFIIDT